MASLPGNPHAAASVRADAHIGETIIAPEGQTDATLLASVIQANTSAILALAHEQRTALLINLLRVGSSGVLWTRVHTHRMVAGLQGLDTSTEEYLQQVHTSHSTLNQCKDRVD